MSTRPGDSGFPETKADLTTGRDELMGPYGWERRSVASEA